MTNDEVLEQLYETFGVTREEVEAFDRKTGWSEAKAAAEQERQQFIAYMTARHHQLTADIERLFGQEQP